MHTHAQGLKKNNVKNKCDICDKYVLAANMSRHIQHMHKVEGDGPFRESYIEVIKVVVPLHK